MHILAIGCHPDDLEIGCFGTLARYVKEGHTVTVCHVTNGNLGHVVIPPGKLRQIRNAEAEKAAKVIGAECVTLDVSDLTVDSMDNAMCGSLVTLMRRIRPDVLISHAPQDYMRDHVETGLMAFRASFQTTITHLYPEVEACGQVAPLYYMDTLAGIDFNPTEYVDISSVIDLKLEALACHASQIVWMKDHDGIDFIDFVRTCSKFRGLQCSVAYAEGFTQCKTWPRMLAKRLLP
ncbi:MAG: PIG-L deacetylase family protein [Sphaerochaetaceae bacterium]